MEIGKQPQQGPIPPSVATPQPMPSPTPPPSVPATGIASGTDTPSFKKNNVLEKDSVHFEKQNKRKNNEKHPGKAVLSFFFPGAGQAANKQFGLAAMTGAAGAAMYGLIGHVGYKLRKDGRAPEEAIDGMIRTAKSPKLAMVKLAAVAASIIAIPLIHTWSATQAYYGNENPKK